ncbi:DNA polymerase III subunit chi [Methylophilaceae bacterium]|nr:DNA polymerase III subunit chi [Methylophilaceae bacterium]
MTRIEFFFNVEDKLRKVAELSGAAVGKGRKLMVLTPDRETAARLGHVLWTQAPTGFLPHCRLDHALAAETPILIDWNAGQVPHHDVLINLQQSQPAFFSRFTRLIEIVGADEEDKVHARARYKFYRDRGYELRSFDASGAAL